MQKVNILLSTYNGEAYLEEQLQSLFAQTYDNIEIHVRDDGSTDGTKGILRKYAKEGKIKLYEGENLGYKGSFHWLLTHCCDAEYISYCDQDDIWFPDKIEVSVNALGGYEDCPALFLSDFYWCDEDAKPVRQNRAYQKEHNIQKYITVGDNNNFGFTMVMNHKTAEDIRGKENVSLCCHDSIVYQYCLCNGYVIWGKTPEAYYRRHGGNTSPHEYVGGNRVTHLIWQIKSFLLTDNKAEIYWRADEFLQRFSEEIPLDKKKIYQFYLMKGHRLKKAAWNRRYRDKLWDEFCIRILFLLGRM